MNWQTAYAIQARSDLKARECLIRNASLPECHQLHFLQMACEKLCKAYLARQGTDPDDLRTSHAYVAKPLTIIARQVLSRSASKTQRETWVVDAIRKLARQIELLAPAVDDAGSVPANCEYPWVSSNGTIRVPAQHSFGLDLLHQKAGTTLLKVLHAAINDILSESPE